MSERERGEVRGAALPTPAGREHAVETDCLPMTRRVSRRRGGGCLSLSLSLSHTHRISIALPAVVTASSGDDETGFEAGAYVFLSIFLSHTQSLSLLSAVVTASSADDETGF